MRIAVIGSGISGMVNEAVLHTDERVLVSAEWALAEFAEWCKLAATG